MSVTVHNVKLRHRLKCPGFGVCKWLSTSLRLWSWPVKGHPRGGKLLWIGWSRDDSHDRTICFVLVWFFSFLISQHLSPNKVCLMVIAENVCGCVVLYSVYMCPVVSFIKCSVFSIGEARSRASPLERLSSQQSASPECIQEEILALQPSWLVIARV